MKKLLFFIPLTAAAIMYSSLSHAGRDHGWGGGHGHGWGHHRHHHEHYYPQPQINYYPQPQINYYPPPQVNYYPQPQVNYYPQPRVNYYPPQPRYDQRSHQGLAGGVIGSVFGYEIGNGDPVAAGLGAAAGSFLGNGVGGRR
ncbi:MAG: hypothetical protein PHG00_03425 [Methylococcales bacterium]|nr:hypothetical protein [Methylococcales bacterium]